MTRDKPRVAEAPEELPEMAEALRTGEVDPEVVEAASCDAQRIGSVRVGADGDSAKAGRSVVPRATQDIPPAVRRAVLHRDGRCCVFPGCRSARFLDLHHIKAARRRRRP